MVDISDWGSSDPTPAPAAGTQTDSTQAPAAPPAAAMADMWKQAQQVQSPPQQDPAQQQGQPAAPQAAPPAMQDGQQFSPTAVPPSPAGQQASGAVDISDWHPLPKAVDGSSPMTPMNRSPLTPDDHLKMAMGDERGKMDYLKSRFQDVTKIEEGPLKGNLVVNDQGAWHLVDGKSYGDVDSWTATKGILKGTLASMQMFGDKMAGKAPGISKESDLSDSLIEGDAVANEAAGKIAKYAPAVGSMAALGVVNSLTAGAPLAIQAGAAATAAIIARGGITSMGRLEGTYQATPEEQTKDLAFEGMLNAGAVFVPPGVKYGADKIADALPGWAKNFSLMPQSVRDTFKALYGKLAVGSGDHIDEAMENTANVKELMKMGDAAGKDYKSVIFQDQVGKVRDAAKTGKQILSGLWSKMQDQLVKAVPSNFVGDVTAVTDGAFKDLAKQGIVELEVAGKRLSAADAAEFLANSEGKSIAKSAKWVMKSQEDLLKVFREGGLDVADAALNDKHHAALSQVVGTLNDLRGSKAYGADGVKMITRASQVLDDLTYQLKQQGKEQAVNSIERSMSALHQQISQGVRAQFEKYGAGAAYDAVNTSYSQVKRPMTDLMNAVAKAERTGSDAPLEQFIKKIGAKSSAQAPKTAFNQVSELADKYGLKGLAQEFDGHAARIRAGDAAVAFNPYIKPGIVSGATATFAVTALATGHALPAAAAVGAMVGTSPRLALNTAVGIQALKASKAQLAVLGEAGVRKLAQNPQAVAMFARATMQAPAVSEAISSHLTQPAMQMMRGGQPGGGGQ